MRKTSKKMYNVVLEFLKHKSGLEIKLIKAGGIAAFSNLENITIGKVKHDCNRGCQTPTKVAI